MTRLVLATLALGCRATLTLTLPTSPDGSTADASMPVLEAGVTDLGVTSEAWPDVRDGAAERECPNGLTPCATACADFQRDPENCGGCGVRCPLHPRGGRWRCLAGRDRGVCGDRIVDLSLGQGHICVLHAQGIVSCWGANSYGQVGDGTTRDRETPVFVSGLEGTTMSSVHAGRSHACASSGPAGITYCWGRNESGQLGAGIGGPDQRSTSRLEVQVVSSVVDMALGAAHTCAFGAGSMWCWGDNTWGQLGDGTMNARFTPVAISPPGGLAAARMSAGEEHSCLIDTAGGVWCWGNDNGRLGAGTGRGTSSTPVRVLGLSGMMEQVAAGSEHTCARRLSGVSYCWGANHRGQLGDRTTVDRASAVPIADLQNLKWLAVSASGGHSCAVDENSAIWCWGLNDHGQVGNGATTDRLWPTRVMTPEGVNFSRVVLGGSATCGLSTSGAIWCWGDLGDIEPTVRARRPGSTSVPVPMRLTVFGGEG